MSAKGRVFNCIQYEKNPKTGQDLHFNEAVITHCVDTHKSIKRYAYIRHDKDEVTEADIANGSGTYTESDLGKPKPAHWHIVFDMGKTAFPVSSIAKWLNIPENMIDIPKGQGAFIDCVSYLTHADARQELQGKHVYDSSEVVANFDWKPLVDERLARKTKYGKNLSEAEFLLMSVLKDGMPVSEVIDSHPDIYMKYSRKFDSFRTKYLCEYAPMPTYRINFYIEGSSASGKDLMSKAIARSLFPDIKDDSKLFFEVGGDNVTLDGYDGEPVIIWSEFRAETFLNSFKGYENVLALFDIIPKNKSYHIKYGRTRLVNRVNIVNSTQNYELFLRGLVDSRDDRAQSRRRFPIIIPIRSDCFDIYVNCGYLGGDDFWDYAVINSVKGSMSKLASRFGSRVDARRRVESHMVEPIVTIKNDIEFQLKQSDFCEDILDDELVDLCINDYEFGSVTGSLAYHDWLRDKQYALCVSRQGCPKEGKCSYRCRYFHALLEKYTNECKDDPVFGFDTWKRQCEVMNLIESELPCLKPVPVGETII